MNITLGTDTINRIEKNLSVGSWKCDNCDATGEGVELLFNYHGFAHCPDCCSTEVHECREEPEDEND